MHFLVRLYCACFLILTSWRLEAASIKQNNGATRTDSSIAAQYGSGCPVLPVIDGEIAECRGQTTGILTNCSVQGSPENTVAEIGCQQFWNLKNNTSRFITRTCRNGKWVSSNPDFECQLECGVANYNILNDRKVVVLKSGTPWVAGIFSLEEEEDPRQRFQFNCEGTLISRRAILTSAKCVTFNNTSVDRRPKDLKIALGNFSSSFSMNMRLLHGVEKVIVHHEYNATDLRNDLALIWLSKPIKPDPYQHPICLPNEDDELDIGSEGKVTVVEDQSHAERSISVMSSSICRKNYPSLAHLKSTKLCANSNNDPLICKTLGMGTAFPHATTAKKWVLQGIRSGIPSSDCQLPIIFTKVALFRPWVDKELIREPPIYTKSGIIPLTATLPISSQHPSIVPAILRTTPSPSFTTSSSIFPAIFHTTAKPKREREPLTPEPFLVPHYTTPRPSEIETLSRRSMSPATVKPMSGNYDHRRTTKFPSDLYPVLPTRFPISTPKPQVSRHHSTTRTTASLPAPTEKVTIEPILTKNSDTFHCPPLQSIPGVTQLCKQDAYEDIDDCSNGGEIGTVATLSCNKYYNSAFGPATLRKECMADKRWSPPRPFGCKLECGISSNPRKSFIANGVPSDRVSWPWHAALFKRIDDTFRYICGATLISRSVLITAAHCISKPMTSETVDVEDLRVVLAAKSSNYTENLFDPISQPNVFYIKKIAIPDTYNGITFESDIALIKLEFNVQLSDYVKPICFPFQRKEDSDIVQLQLSPGTKGYTVGLGIDESGHLSNNMKETSLPVVSHRECGEVLARFPSHAMFCAGYLNGSSAVCNGDSGSGLVFSEGTGFSNRFIIQGIVSYGDHVLGSRGCNKKTYAVFTKVNSFAGWVQEQLDLFEPE